MVYYSLKLLPWCMSGYKKITRNDGQIQRNVNEKIVGWKVCTFFRLRNKPKCVLRK